ncbi:hypothetical protein Cabys_456 [Caldithrix abyssi DSM 13497]|uniref:Uncharacterized protein n=1 Tax=Caldithrix abyssi DSM 13497 TaxID=880073 RepID=A0A1J1C3I1_CALAY|nr:hypothetical protein Cabys_456 [Caldithrix abyssi DSM 13497]
MIAQPSPLLSYMFGVRKQKIQLFSIPPIETLALNFTMA